MPMESISYWIGGSVALYHVIKSFSKAWCSTPSNKIQLHKRIVIVTRIHCLISDQFPANDRIVSFLTNAVACEVDGVIICIGAKTLEQLGILKNHIQAVIDSMKLSNFASVLPVYPWGYFTNALNQAILVGQDNHFSHVLFQSFEVKLCKDSISKLSSQFDEQTLVVGLALEGHTFFPGTHQLNGRNVPWNTAAMWALPKLALLGFPLIADGFEIDRSVGGVEELCAISLLQLINPSYSAKMLRNTQDPSMWNTDFGKDDARRQYHEKKMASKLTRAKAQIDALGITPGTVQHFEM